MNKFPRFAFALALSLLPAGTTFSRAADAGTAKERKLPFHGKLAAVDTGAQTITLSGKSSRVFHLAPDTKITDGSGNPSTLAAAVVGEDVGGSYMKGADNVMTLYSVRFGAKTKGAASAATETETSSAPAAPAPKSAPVTAAPAPVATSSPGATGAAASAPAPAAAPEALSMKKMHFSGKVVSVNAPGNSFVVHGKSDQTFMVTADTKMKGAASLSALAAGAKVSGSYTKSADGTLTVTSLKASK